MFFHNNTNKARGIVVNERILQLNGAEAHIQRMYAMLSNIIATNKRAICESIGDSRSTAKALDISIEMTDANILTINGDWLKLEKFMIGQGVEILRESISPLGDVVPTRHDANVCKPS